MYLEPPIFFFFFFLWRFKIKTENGVITWFKARLCVNGSSVNQKLKADPNIEFEDNYSGSATSTSMNLTYTIAAAYGLEVHFSDVPSAYVQSEMPEGDVVYYVEQPEGFADPTKPDHVCKLNMALYGVPVAGQRWNLTFHKFLTEELKFVCCDSDPNLYIHREQDGNFCIMPTAVDDTLNICTSQELHEEIHAKLYKWFKWKSSGSCDWFLGCSVKQNFKEISIDQHAFLDNLIKSFEWFNPKPVNNPAISTLLSELEEDEPKTDFPYSSLVGSLNWLTKTWPDISYAVSQCSHYLHNHCQRHDKAALRILRYLKKFSDYGLNFLKLDDNERKDLFFDAYSDSSFSDCPDDCTSSYGYVMRINGRPISWRSKKEPQIYLSSCEAEYHAMTETIREITFIENLLCELELPHNKPVILNVDSEPARVIATIPQVTQRNKHFNWKDHYVRHKVADETVEIKHVPTAENLADIFTKPLTPAKLNPLREDLISQCAAGDHWTIWDDFKLGEVCYEPCSVVFYSIWCHPVTPLLWLITALSLSLFPFSVVFFPLYYFPFSYFSWCLFYPFLIWFCPCFLPQKCCFCIPFYSCHDHISTVFSLPSHFSLLSKCSPCLFPWINLHFQFDLWFGFAFVLSVSPEIQSIWHQTPNSFRIATLSNSPKRKKTNRNFKPTQLLSETEDQRRGKEFKSCSFWHLLHSSGQ